jgi:CHASE1-domain containing sensor protein
MSSKSVWMAKNTNTKKVTQCHQHHHHRHPAGIVVVAIKKYNGTWPIVVLILVLGMAASAAFVGLGTMAAQRDFEHQFHQESLEVAKAIQDVITDSEVAGRWIHEACTRDDRFTTSSNSAANISSILSSRMAFREVYENLQHADSFQAVGFCPNVTHVQRAAFEAESRLYYETTHLNDMNYVGFIATTTTNNSQHDLTGKEEPKDMDAPQLVESSPVAPFYFPWHYLEPFTEENEVDVDLDLYSGSSTRQAIQTALQTWQPALTGRLHILKEDDPHSIAYSVMLIHPGIPLSTQPDRQPQHVAVVEIRIHAILERALPYPVVPVPLSIYLYDTSNSNRGQQAEFLGGVVNYDGRHGTKLTFSPSDADAFSVNLDDYDLQQAYIHELSIGNSSR